MSSAASARPPSTGLWLFEELRAAIIRGEYPAGEPIRQEDIADRFQVSRMPVREAMRLLEAEGLVTKQPHRGAVVAQLDAEDALELFQIRAALEGVAVHRSFPTLDDIQVAAIERAHVALEEAGASEKLAKHAAFHLALYAAAGPRLQKMISDQLDAAQRYHLRFGRPGMEVSDRDRKEHIALVDAARRRDADTAFDIIVSHVSDGGVMIARSIAAMDDRRTQATAEQD
jgi:DNA-binding GntR family transcriptional regulator